MQKNGIASAAALIFCGGLIGAANSAWAQQPGSDPNPQRPPRLMKMMLNGRPVGESVPYAVVDGAVMVPIRFIAENLGGQVEWNKRDHGVHINYGTKDIRLTVGSTQAYLNNEGRALRVPPTMRQGRVLLPLRDVGRFMDAQVQYNGQTRTVFIQTAGS